jgi:hypothetical protein
MSRYTSMLSHFGRIGAGIELLDLPLFDKALLVLEHFQAAI